MGNDLAEKNDFRLKTPQINDLSNICAKLWPLE